MKNPYNLSILPSISYSKNPNVPLKSPIITSIFRSKTFKQTDTNGQLRISTNSLTLQLAVSNWYWPQGSIKSGFVSCCPSITRQKTIWKLSSSSWWNTGQVELCWHRAFLKSTPTLMDQKQRRLGFVSFLKRKKF